MLKKSDVENVLIDMGVPANLSGFKYIIQAVLLLDTREYTINPQWCNLYREVGKLCDSTGSRVERAIRHALVVTRSRGHSEKVAYYIGDNHNNNSSSLAMLYLRLKQEERGKNQ